MKYILEHSESPFDSHNTSRIIIALTECPGLTTGVSKVLLLLAR